MKKTLAFSLLLISTQVHAMKYVIFTDQEDTKKAQEVVEVMKNTYPFSVHKVTFEIVKVTSAELDCGSTIRGNEEDIAMRLASCDNSAFAVRASRMGGDQAMIIKDSINFGGAATTGGVPVMTTGSSARVMLHEYMHVLGLCDEYEYTQAQADIYCNETKVNSSGTTYFESRSGYASDAVARSAHSNEIPWYGDILRTTPIVSGSQLGTGSVGLEQEAPNNTKIPAALAGPIGLFEGKVCKKASVKKTAWVPGGKITLMENYEAGLGAQMEKSVDKFLTSKGALPRELAFSQPVETVETAQIGQTVQIAQIAQIETSRMDPAVNDSPRNFFKDFFRSFGNMFKRSSRGVER